MNRRNFLTQSAMAIAQTVLQVRQAVGADQAPAYRPGKHGFPNVTLHTQENKTVRFYDDLVKGKHVVVNFMYASCPDSCPLQTANLVLVQKALGPRVGRDIFMYSITLDPTHDTPEVLKGYAERFGVGPGWLFLTGRPDDTELLRRKLGFVDSDPIVDRDKSNHIGVVLYGNDRLDRWAACPALSRARDIAEYVLWMEELKSKPASAIGAIERGVAALPA